MNIFEDGIGNKEKGLVFHRKLQFHKHPISCMTFTDDQKYIWTADVTGNCFIWNSDVLLPFIYYYLLFFLFIFIFILFLIFYFSLLFYFIILFVYLIVFIFILFLFFN